MPTPPAPGGAPAAWVETQLDRVTLAELAGRLPVGAQDADKRALRRFATDRLLGWLEGWPGASWQERWQASGSEALGRSWVEVPAAALQAHTPRPPSLHVARRGVIVGISALLCLRVLRPGYAWLFAAHFNETYGWVRQLTDPEFFAEALERCRAAGTCCATLRSSRLAPLTCGLRCGVGSAASPSWSTPTSSPAGQSATCWCATSPSVPPASTTARWPAWPGVWSARSGRIWRLTIRASARLISPPRSLPRGSCAPPANAAPKSTARPAPTPTGCCLRSAPSTWTWPSGRWKTPAGRPGPCRARSGWTTCVAA